MLVILSVLIWIQTVCLSESVPVKFFELKLILKKVRRQQKHKNAQNAKS